MKKKEYLDMDLDAIHQFALENYPEPKTLDCAGSSKLSPKIRHVSGLAGAGIGCKKEWTTDFCNVCFGLTVAKVRKVKSIYNSFPIYQKSVYYDYWAKNNLNLLEKKLNFSLKESYSSLLRPHMVSDFLSWEHIMVWYETMKRNHDKKIFFYTRSWLGEEETMPSLRRLINLPNVVGLASTDPYTPAPPEGMKEAAIMGALKQKGKVYTICPYQLHLVKDCAQCKLCFLPEVKNNIVFLEHGGSDVRTINKLYKEEGGSKSIYINKVGEHISNKYNHYNVRGINVYV